MTKQLQKIPFTLALLPVIGTVIGLFSVLFLFRQVPLYFGIIGGWLIGMIVGMISGFPLYDLFRGTYSGMKSTFGVVTIMLLIGAVIAAWMAGGTVPGLIVYGIQLLHPNYLLVISFFLTAVVSMVLGTSVGTLSTMGVALAGIASVYGIPAGLMGGALISGAMIGDRTSPMSGAFHLVSQTTGVQPDRLLRLLIRSALPLVVVSFILFAWLGWSYGSHPATEQIAADKVRLIQSLYSLPWYVLIPPGVVLTLAYLRFPIRQNLLIGAILGTLLALIVQHQGLSTMAGILWGGFTLQSAGHAVLQGGGVWPMFNQMLVVITAGALNGLLETTGIITVLVGKWLDRIHTEGELTTGTVVTALSSGVVFCNQALMVLVPARMFTNKYRNMGVPQEKLAVTLSNSGVVSSALIPWNLHGLLCSAAMGIPTLVYAPYAFFLWMFPVITVLTGFLRFPKRFKFDTR